MNWIKRNTVQWLGAWFQIFDYLVCILTLEFFYSEAIAWFYGGDFGFYKEHPPSYSIKNRIRWWIFDWISIFEKLLIILTLGVLQTSRLSTFFLNWSGP